MSNESEHQFAHRVLGRKARAKHTPGPWKAEQHSGFEWSIVVRDGAKMDGATVAYQIFQEPEANARLIAAAPDMLASLKALFQHCAMIHKHWGEGCNRAEADAAIEQAKAAIAKAEGQ